MQLNDVEKLIGQVALRDRAAFLALYQATSAKLFGVCLRILGDRAESEDALQEAYVRIWQRADQYAQRGYSPMTWLITIARNLAIDHLRARRAPADGTEVLETLPDSGPNPEQAALAADEGAQLGACLDGLDPVHSDAVRRVYLDGDSYQDLATRHDVPLNTMRTWLRRSLQKLKECLSK
ncbi:sigma-70 family RNA polymerase sigma factor [Abyssibius alkaniclasticus]|uniref:sigma-70 family RNA polymerase sigma factor n=1 Tax=Abyssibius alkaniclasticus TaxID=2881234 RepID=UPI0023645DDC|nr:sigma-70 family RNA polymerase sigma factor [Abyssibius alkaniclasticus]UPH69947.1 sigma-70 family RNA polymerase sigma factor [Abyssibius alkaniclasticus]